MGSAQPGAMTGPEMERLAFLLGTWDAEDKYEKTEFNPDGGEGSGSYKTVPGPGGFSLVTDYHYQAPHGSSSGHQARYVGYVVSSSFPGGLVASGNWDASNFVLGGDFEARGMRNAFRQVSSDITPRSMILRQYNSIEGAPSQLFGTTVLTRRTD